MDSNYNENETMYHVSDNLDQEMGVVATLEGTLDGKAYKHVIPCKHMLMVAKTPQGEEKGTLRVVQMGRGSNLDTVELVGNLWLQVLANLSVEEAKNATEQLYQKSKVEIVNKMTQGLLKDLFGDILRER